MKTKEKTTQTTKECCSSSEDSFDCAVIKQKMQRLFSSMSEEDASFDCKTMMQKMCRSTSKESEA